MQKKRGLIVKSLFLCLRIKLCTVNKLDSNCIIAHANSACCTRSFWHLFLGSFNNQYVITDSYVTSLNLLVTEINSKVCIKIKLIIVYNVAFTAGLTVNTLCHNKVKFIHFPLI